MLHPVTKTQTCADSNTGMQLLQDVLTHYLKSRKAKVAKLTGSPDQAAILSGLPDFFEKVLSKTPDLDPDHYKIEGSIGNGNIARVPWVAIFNRSVTTSAQNGYYIVLLFSQDMKSCYLSLNQGFVSFEAQYTQKLARDKVREYAARATQCFVFAKEATAGPIDLAATGQLGKGYEAASIESFRYDASTLPTSKTFTANLQQLLAHYELLISIAGPSLELLAPITEQEYQKAALETSSTTSAKLALVDIPKPKPAPIQTPVSKAYRRNPQVAGQALAAANFRCEVNHCHETFTSQAKKRPYIEAHHLVPMALQDQYQHSLDVGANIVGLCPNCHKLLHMGLAAEKKPLLMKLFSQRGPRLATVGIPMDSAKLLAHYKTELPEDAA
jgi:5-methylcytosine-specific restriction protein A